MNLPKLDLKIELSSSQLSPAGIAQNIRGFKG